MTKNTEFNLWHYTTADGLKGILSHKTLWATDCRYLNDSLEFIYAKIIIHQALLPKVISTIKDLCEKNPNAKRITESYGGIQKTADLETNDTIEILFNSMFMLGFPFVLSFCMGPKDDSKEGQFLQKNGLLSQWRGYGKDGGYAVIFDLEDLDKMLENENKSFYYGAIGDNAIVYDTSKLESTDKIKKHLDLIGVYAYRVCESRLFGKKPPIAEGDEVKALFTCMASLKHKGFQEENEYRYCIMPQNKEWLNSPYYEEDKNKSFKEIKTRNNRGTLVPYIELFNSSGNLPIKRICVGPHRDKELRAESIKTYLRSEGLTNIEVFCSDIPYIGSR